jgi:hypothetical protein
VLGTGHGCLDAIEIRKNAIRINDLLAPLNGHRSQWAHLVEQVAEEPLVQTSEDENEQSPAPCCNNRRQQQLPECAAKHST